MTVLVLGASGLLGSNVTMAATNRGFDVVGTFHTNEPDLQIKSYRCDLTDADRTRALFERCDPDLVVNCAAMTDVDACERQPEAAREINADAPRQIAQLCNAGDRTLVHVSTDYVFDGEQRYPYAESATPDPRQVYGWTKLKGEQAVADVTTDALVVRLSFVYGVHCGSGKLTGFPAWVASELTAGKDIPAFTDQYVTPSRAQQVTETVFRLVEGDESGLFHIACRDCVTPFEFAERVSDRLNATGSVNKSLSTDLDRLAPRPDYTCLDVTKVEKVLGRAQPTLREELESLPLG